MTPLIQIGLAWLSGLFLGRWFEPPLGLLMWLLGPVALAGYLYRDKPLVRRGAIMVVVAGLGAARLLVSQPVIDERHPAFYNDHPHRVELTGLVIDEPDIRDNYQNLRVAVEYLDQAGERRPVEGLVLVRTSRYPPRSYGERLIIRGHLETPPIFEDFSYKDYLARFDIHSLMRRPQIELVASGQGNPFWATMYVFKDRAGQTINRILNEPYASLLTGIVLGRENNIPDELYEQFNLTGTSHIIVISGSNIAIVAGIWLLLGQQIIGRVQAAPLALGGVIGYTFLVGADAAVSRAAVMGGVWIFALWIGRPGMALNSLFVAAIGLTALQPLMLWDVGFQLSFMATLGLIVLVPLLERWLWPHLRQRFKWRQAKLTMALMSQLFIITLAAQIITAPLISYHFGRLSLISLLANLLIGPAQPFIMILGGLATVVGMIWLPVGQLFGWFVWLPLAWTVWVVEGLAGWPGATIDLGDVPGWLMVWCYLVIAAGVWWANQSQARFPAYQFSLPSFGSTVTRLGLGGSFSLTLLIWLAVWSLPDGKLHVAFLEVGQGDAIFITLPDGRQILIDGGPAPSQLQWRLGQQMPFWDRSLDMVINTHPETDHLNGLLPLLERYHIGQILVPAVVANSQLYREWQAQLTVHQIEPIIGEAGQQFALGHGVVARLINPGETLPGEDKLNNHSLVIHLQWGNVSFLLPGDIEEVVERQLVAQGNVPQATVLKSPHHGSQTSSSDAFLDAVNPHLVVIQVGAENRFGHPAPAVLTRYTDRGLMVLRTDKHGTIELTTDGRQLWIETAR